MKKVIYPAMIVVIMMASAFTVVSNTSKWSVKEDAYSVKFTSSKFEGSFKGLKSELIFDESNLGASKISATIEASSVNTGNGMRNKHAKQGLDAEKFSTVKFVSSSISKSGNGYTATGNLTIKDVTKQISIPFTFTKNADGGVFEGTFSVVPAEYNVTKAGTPERLDFQLNVPVKK
jgi:polyisoprenoid-binding protein YceI